MESVFRYLSPPSPCGYLPKERWRLENEVVAQLSPDEYMERLLQGWRRFGANLFRPRCSRCDACRSIRIAVDSFRPDRGMRRTHKLNEGTIRLAIGSPRVSRDRLDLYDRYHAFQADAKGWPEHDAKDAASYARSFVDNPIPTQEWCYFHEERLVGVGYVDDLPGGLSAIYFFYDPEYREHSLGTWNILQLVERAGERRLPYVYLGYYVEGCHSMAYKARFRPNQILNRDGKWQWFRR